MLPSIHAIVVSGAKKDTVKRCLMALRVARSSTEHTLSVSFIDNSGCGAYADLGEIFPDFHYLSNAQPRGFAANHNLVFNGESDFALLLNNDAFIEQNTLSRMLETLNRNPHWAAVSARLLNSDLTDQGTCFGFPSERSALRAAFTISSRFLIHGERLPTPDIDSSSDWVPATCLLMRRAAMKEIGRLDTLFDPGYAEDIDWCQRAHQKGWQVGMCAAASVTHLGSATFRKDLAARLDLAVRNICLYHAKHHTTRLAKRVARVWQMGFLLRFTLVRCLPGRASQLKAASYHAARRVAGQICSMMLADDRPADGDTLRRIAAASLPQTRSARPNS